MLSMFMSISKFGTLKRRLKTDPVRATTLWPRMLCYWLIMIPSPWSYQQSIVSWSSFKLNCS